MKIVHVIHCCSAGGAEILAKSIIENIKDINNKDEIELWAIYKAEILYKGDISSIEFEKQYINDLNKVNVSVKIINKKKGITERLKLIKNIRKFYKIFKPDIIHCHLETVTFHIVSSLFFKKVKIIETIHNIKIINKNLHKYFLNHKIDKFVAISKRVAEVIKSDLGISEEKIKVIYNGINLEKFKGEYSINENVKDIVAVGRLTKQKDHLNLLKAFKNFKEICEENNERVPRLNIIGDGELRNELIDYATANNLKEVRFLGIVNNIPEILFNNQIYVMSSIFEGLSLSLMEAVASGISIICTDVGSNTEIIKNNRNGIIVEPSNPDKLCAKLYELAHDKNMRENFYKNNKLDCESFNIKDCALKHLEFYKELLKKDFNILYVGSLSKKRNRLDGVTIKSRVLEEWLKSQEDITVKVVDVDGWEKYFIKIIYEIVTKYLKCNKIVICSSSRGAYILLKFLKKINNKKDIFYFIAGGELANMIKNRKFNIEIYKPIKKMYSEPIDMMEDMKKLGLKNIEQKNNFRKVINRPNLKAANKEIKLVFFSRVIKVKGIEEAIKVFSKLKSKYRNISLDIYGQVTEEYLMFLKKSFVEGIQYKGVIIPNNCDEYRILSNYDIFVLPTYHTGEGLPGALIDAYISGLAVVVSRWKYASQYVDDNKVGLIHEYKNYDDLYKKLELLINNSDKVSELRKQSYLKAEEFLIENVMAGFKTELLS